MAGLTDHDPDAAECGCQACWWERRRAARAVQEARAARTAAIRSPPKPWLADGHRGCSLCSGHIEAPRRTWCSQACVDLWHIATSGQSARRQLIELHGHACWECDARWQPGPDYGWTYETGPPLPRPAALFLDHRRPLWSLTTTERGELRWWLPFNLQMLCGDCHAAKTKREAAERATIRRSTHASG